MKEYDKPYFDEDEFIYKNIFSYFYNDEHECMLCLNSEVVTIVKEYYKWHNGHNPSQKIIDIVCKDYKFFTINHDDLELIVVKDITVFKLMNKIVKL